MKVLVTGGTGFIGRHLVQTLLNRHHRIYVVSRCPNLHRQLSWFHQVPWIEGDVFAQDWSELNQGLSWDAVVHLAWPGLPNYRDPRHVDEYLPANCRFISSLLAAGIPKLLVTGTCLEYGLQQGCLEEDRIPQPVVPYGIAKNQLREFLVSHPAIGRCEWTWARLFYTYGAGQNPQSLLSQVDRAVQRGDSSFDMSPGDQLRDYLPIESLVQFLACLIESKEGAGIVNICSGTPISVRSLVESHLRNRKLQLTLNLGVYPYPDYEPHSFWGSCQKLQALLPMIQPAAAK